MNYHAAVDFLDRYQGDPLVHLCMQAHTTYTTNQRMLEDILRITKERNIGFITHAADPRGNWNSFKKNMENPRSKY